MSTSRQPGAAASPWWAARAVRVGLTGAAVLDVARHRALLASKDWVRPFIRDRELRVAVMGMVVVASAALATLVAPLWSLALGPLVLGVPHLLVDVRYLAAAPGHLADRRWLAAVGVPLVFSGLGGGVVAGLVAATGAVLVLGVSPRRRVMGLLVVAAVALALAALPIAPDLVFAHAHNFLAVLLWWLWRPRRGRLHLLPLALFAACGIALLGGALAPLDLPLVAPDGGGWREHLAQLAPGLPPDAATRLVLLFAFAQSVHYGIWLRLVPEEDRARDTPRTFAASLRALERDLGAPALVGTAALALGLIVWALFDLGAARDGYFRLATFHGSLELSALAALVAGGASLRTRS